MGDRRHKTLRFITEDSNQAHDSHDFADGYKAIPLAIAMAICEDAFATSIDSHGNLRVVIPDKWNLTFSIRFNRLAGVDLKTTFSQHIDDLEFVIDARLDGKLPADVYLDSDSGSDSNYHTLRAQVYLAEFFKKKLLGTVVESGPASGDSPTNPVERLLAEPKKAINTLQIPDVVGEDTVSPAQQSDLTQTQRIIKESSIYESTGASLKQAWEKLDVYGDPILVRYLVPTVPSLWLLFLLAFSLPRSFCSRLTNSLGRRYYLRCSS